MWLFKEPLFSTTSWMFWSRHFPERQLVPLFKPPIDNRTADLQWRVVHGAIATNRYRAHLHPELREGCTFCSQAETPEHVFVLCPRLTELFELLKGWFQGLMKCFLFACSSLAPNTVQKRNLHIHWWTASLVLLSRHWAHNTGSGELVPVLKGLLKDAWEWNMLTIKWWTTWGTSDIFWLLGVLCSVGGRELFLIFYQKKTFSVFGPLSLGSCFFVFFVLLSEDVWMIWLLLVKSFNQVTFKPQTSLSLSAAAKPQWGGRGWDQWRAAWKGKNCDRSWNQ